MHNELALQSAKELAIRLLHQRLSLADSLWVAAESLCQIFSLDGCAILLNENESLYIKSAFRNQERVELSKLANLQIDLEQGRLGRVSNTQIAESGECEGAILNQVLFDSEQSELIIPLLAGKTTLGLLTCFKNQSHGFSTNDLESWQHIGQLLSLRIEASVQASPASNSPSESDEASRIDSLGVFVGGVAHDFNNHLQSIVSSIMAAKAIAPSNLSPFLDIALQACKRSRGLTQQLMSFAKGGAPQLTEVDLEALVRETAHLILTGRKSEFELKIEPGPKIVKVDRSQIEQVVTNLLINADQAQPSGGTIRIEVGTGNMPSNPIRSAVNFQIHDEGYGIEKESLNKILEPYYSTKPDGSGLGLATSHIILQRHGGEIDIQSELGVGTSISVFLPAADSSISASPQPTSQEPPTRILFLDDEPLIRSSIVALIQSLGYDAVAAGTAKEAFELFDEARENKTPFELVILDLNIPDSDGATVMRGLNQREPNLKGIATSGSANDSVIQNPHDYGFDGTLPKPFNRAMLKQEIEKALENKATQT